MIGIDRSGAVRIKEPRSTRWSRRQPSLDELTGMGPRFDRYKAMRDLWKAGWSAKRIGNLLGVTERFVHKVLKDTREAFDEDLD